MTETNQTPQTEIRLIREAASGNVGAYSQLVSQHRERVLRAAYGVLGSIDEAEDVAQDVFVKAWQKLDSYNHEASFSSWIYRITINTAIDVLRRRKEQVALDPQLAELGSGPEATLLQNDTQNRIRQAIAELPDHSRATIILREYEQLSYKEISEILEIPIGTVMSRLNYARRMLREKLASESLEQEQVSS